MKWNGKMENILVRFDDEKDIFGRLEFSIDGVTYINYLDLVKTYAWCYKDPKILQREFYLDDLMEMCAYLGAKQDEYGSGYYGKF